MTIKIVLPKSDGKKSSNGTQVFTECGIEIKDVSRIKIDILPNCMIEAEITISVESIENLNGIEGIFIPDISAKPSFCGLVLMIIKRFFRGLK